MKPMQWVKTPKGYVIFALICLLSVASIGTHSIRGIQLGAVAVGTTLALDIICCLIERRKRIFPDGAVITGLIIALIMSITSSWIAVAVTSAIAILSKHVLSHAKKPIFNPAAVGLLLSIPLFQAQQSWWGAFGDLPSWLLIVLIIGGYAVTNRIHKFPQVFAFLGTYFIALFIMDSSMLHLGTSTLHAMVVSDALRPPFINAVLFFALFMLTDPPTSPAKIKDQLIFGCLTAVTGAVVYGLFGGLMYLYIGLLIGNLYQLLRTRLAANSSKTRSRGSSGRSERSAAAPRP